MVRDKRVSTGLLGLAKPIVYRQGPLPTNTVLFFGKTSQASQSSRILRRSGTPMASGSSDFQMDWIHLRIVN